MQSNLPLTTPGLPGLRDGRSAQIVSPLHHALGRGLALAHDDGPAASRTSVKISKGARQRMADAVPTGVRMNTMQSAQHANRLLYALSALSADGIERVLPMAELVSLKPGMRLMQAEQTPSHVYFPCSATVSLILTTHQGQTCQVGMIGAEGMVGVQGVVGAMRMPYDAVVSTPGVAQRMSVAALVAQCGPGSAGGALFVRYSQALMAQMAYSVACCQHHNVEQRTCRLLLQGFDASGRELCMTHESMAELLGVRRESVTGVANRLSNDGVISYRRGCISLGDRAALQSRSCECYAAVKHELEMTFQGAAPPSTRWPADDGASVRPPQSQPFLRSSAQPAFG